MSCHLPPERWMESSFGSSLEITDRLSEMIKNVANEPAIGLFYMQQHTENAVPNVISLKNNVEDKSHETDLHTEDLEDSITTVRSMKEFGFHIAEEMVRDIRKSLAIMSTKQPTRGLIHNSSSSFQMGKMISWGPATRGVRAIFSQRGGERESYISTMFKSAKEKAGNLKCSQLDDKELVQIQGAKFLARPDLPVSVAPSSSSRQQSQSDSETDSLFFSSHFTKTSAEEDQVHGSLQSADISSQHEDYEDLVADKVANLNEWLEGTDGLNNRRNSEGHYPTSFGR